MILNMTRLEGISPEHMLRNSFYQFQNTSNLPSLEAEYRCLEEEKDSIMIPDEEDVSEYYELREQLAIHSRDMRDVLNHPVYSVQFLHVGRLVRIEMDGTDFGWGAVVSVSKAKVYTTFHCFVGYYHCDDNKRWSGICDKIILCYERIRFAIAEVTL
jgi:ATP-dependent RNA helicase DOB1